MDYKELYIIFAFKLPGEELQLIPKWTISVTKSSQNPEIGSNKFAFKLGQILGYFTEEGEITLSESLKAKIIYNRIKIMDDIIIRTLFFVSLIKVWYNSKNR